MVATTTQKYYDCNPNAFQRFGAKRDGGRKHRGTDFAHGGGTLVPMLIAGKVTGRLAPASWHGFGHQTTTEGTGPDGRRYRVSYGHGQKASPLKTGVSYPQGTFIQTEGMTGAAVGNCCHVEVYDIAAGKFIDPMILVKKVLAAKAAAPAGSKTHPATVRFGNRGKTVLKLQKILKKRGHKITADSKFGPATRTAVKKVQKRYHLDQDGACGPRTWTVLGY